VKLRTKFSLLAIPVLTAIMLTSVPLAGARDRRWDDRKEDRKDYSVPEGSGGAVMALAAGVLGGALLLSRRKRRGTTA
jgi:MYXO-CTERM domain-containing protein